MNNILKCVRCGEVISAEFVNEHFCKIHIKDIKEVIIDYFIETKTDNNEAIIIAKALNGTLYRLIVSKIKNFTDYPTDFDNENNRQGFDRTINRYSYIEPQTLICQNHIPIFE